MPYPLGYGGRWKTLLDDAVYKSNCVRPLGLSGIEENEARRRGLEKFLIRIARHPVLSSTKLFREFLTAKDEKV